MAKAMKNIEKAFKQNKKHREFKVFGAMSAPAAFAKALSSFSYAFRLCLMPLATVAGGQRALPPSSTPSTQWFRRLAVSEA